MVWVVCVVHPYDLLFVRPASINVNHIRGGQRSYTARANVSNWIEERFDKNYQSGKAVLFERRQYDSVSTSTLREAQKVYLQKQRRKMTCKLPEVGGKDFRSRTWERTNLINYATPDAASPPLTDTSTSTSSSG